MSTPREKSSSLTQAQKTTLVRLITAHNEVLDKGTDYKSIIKRKHAWEEVAQAYNAAHPTPEPRTPMQLKRAWEYLKNRLKSDLHAKQKQIEEGTPPSPSEYDPLMESVAALVKNDLEAFLQAPAAGGSPSTTSTPREKSSSLNYAQKRTLVDLITAHKTVLDKSADHKRILKKKRAWAELAQAYNAVHSSPDPKTPLQLKRAWEYLRSRVKSDFVSHAKQKQCGEGPPPSPPQHDPLVESVMSLIKDDLHYDDSQYDSSCQDASEPPSSSPAYSCHSPCVILQEGNFELNYEEEDRYTEGHSEPAVNDDEPPDLPTTMPTRDHCDGPLPSAASGFERVRGKKRKREEDNKEGSFNSVHENHNNINKRKLELMEEKHIKEMSAIETFEKMCNTVNSFFTKLLENDNIFSQKHFYNSLIPNHPYKSSP